MPTVQALQEGLATYATIPAGVVAELEREQAAAGDPSPLQQQIHSLFTPVAR
ncbi:MAG: hypothetical protein KME13_17295 [Myxacorys californica WJT36-NPBG1]|nr:hypothetical protein [Myxacorys californica WJT36-NPBG1]